MSDEKVEGIATIEGSPRFIIQFKKPLTAEMAQRFSAMWRESVESGNPIVLDADVRIFAINSEGKWALLDESWVLP